MSIKIISEFSVGGTSVLRIVQDGPHFRTECHVEGPADNCWQPWTTHPGTSDGLIEAVDVMTRMIQGNAKFLAQDVLEEREEYA